MIARVGLLLSANPSTSITEDTSYAEASGYTDEIGYEPETGNTEKYRYEPQTGYVEKPGYEPETGSMTESKYMEKPKNTDNSGIPVEPLPPDESDLAPNDEAIDWITFYVDTEALVPVHFDAREASEIAGYLSHKAIVYGYHFDDQWLCIPDASDIAYFVKAAHLTPYSKEMSEISLFHQNLEEISGEFTIDSDVHSVSGMTLEDIAFLLQEYPDLQDIQEAVLIFEREYGVNAYFILSVASHESGYGTSPIAKEKANLFGIGAYLIDAFDSALSFDSRTKSVKYFCILMNEYRENGRTTPIAINELYASDETWASQVVQLMNQFSMNNTIH
jgi:hypothetical protein